MSHIPLFTCLCLDSSNFCEREANVKPVSGGEAGACHKDFADRQLRQFILEQVTCRCLNGSLVSMRIAAQYEDTRRLLPDSRACLQEQYVFVLY
jgi:hypothetical protein